MYQKSQSYDVQFLRYGVRQIEFSVILGHFLPFHPPPDNLENQNLKKLKNNPWRYYHFIHVHHKWQSYDLWFLRYGARRTEFFVILDHFFCPFTTLTTQKIKVWKKWRKCLEILSFYICVPKIMITWLWFLRYGVQPTGFFVVLDCSFFLLPPNDPENQKFWTNEKMTWRYYHFIHV